MTWAQEMKNLAADIKTSHKERSARIGEIKGESRRILGEADDYMKKVATELKEMARDLKDFLAKSEDSRKKDFNVMMGEIRAKIKEIKGNIKNLLSDSEEKRMTDFNALMKDVKEDIGGIKRSVANTLRTAKDLISGYQGERKEAARYWANLGGREEAAPAEGAAPKKKRGRKKK